MVVSNGYGPKINNARHLVVSKDDQDQRVDNYLTRILKGVPKTRIYRLLRKGEVRVNSKRIQPSYRLQAGDDLRLPPLYLAESAKQIPPAKSTSALLASRILYEDDHIMVINKPSGMSVHVGSTVRVGVIEALRHMFPTLPQLELAHRLDADTSGCLVLAKKRRILREIHGLLREGKISKVYTTLTQGSWKKSELNVDVSLHKDYRDGGKHVVSVRHDGKSARTVFSTEETFDGASLMKVKLYTGRTHQIRVHAAHQDHPIAGDDRYGDSDFNKRMHQSGLRRLFLHASSIEFTLPSTNEHIKVVAPLDADLKAVIETLQR